MAVAANPTEARVHLEATDDVSLVTRVAAGDAQALEALYDRYNRVVYSFAIRMLADVSSAEELTQEVFLRLWRQGGSYQQGRGAFLTWLLSITHNMAIDEIRRRKRRPLIQDGDRDNTLYMVPDLKTDVEGEAWLSSLQTLVRDALTEIPEPQRRAIELAYFQGLTQREIAERLGEPLGTIKTRMRLGLLKMRDRLGPMLELDTRLKPTEDAD